MKTRLDFSIPSLLIGLGLVVLLPVFFSTSFMDHIVGKIWIGFCLTIIFLGLWKIERFEILDSYLIKKNLIFIIRRKIELNKIIRYKIKQNDLSSYPEFNLAGIFKIFKNGKRYSNFRRTSIYFKNAPKMTIDERLMTKKDYDNILRTIKRNYKKD